MHLSKHVDPPFPLYPVQPKSWKINLMKKINNSKVLENTKSVHAIKCLFAPLSHTSQVGMLSSFSKPGYQCKQCVHVAVTYLKGNKERVLRSQ